MKRILVPTDFSACAANALEQAFYLARFTGANIHVLNVVYPNEGVDTNAYNAIWSDDYVAERNKGIYAWVRKVQRKSGCSGVSFETICQIGFPVTTIVEMAEETKADLIMMGTTGATGLRGVFLGSIASGVLAKTRKPVMAIPKKALLTKGAHAVFATDFRIKPYEGSMDVLQDLVRFLECEIKLVHILDKPGEQPDPAREAGIRGKFRLIPHDFHYLHDRDVPQAISNFIEAVDAGLLIAIAHDHSIMHKLFYDSITRRLAHRTKVPLLILHDAIADGN